jgi:hypothetical protein
VASYLSSPKCAVTGTGGGGDGAATAGVDAAADPGELICASNSAVKSQQSLAEKKKRSVRVPVWRMAWQGLEGLMST